MWNISYIVNVAIAYTRKIAKAIEDFYDIQQRIKVAESCWTINLLDKVMIVDEIHPQQ